MALHLRRGLGGKREDSFDYLELGHVEEKIADIFFLTWKWKGKVTNV